MESKVREITLKVHDDDPPFWLRYKDRMEVYKLVAKRNFVKVKSLEQSNRLLIVSVCFLLIVVIFGSLYIWQFT